MNQDSFRKLIDASSQKVKSTPVNGPPKPIIKASEPAFKPRKVSKNKNSAYRDRAAERRTGIAGDFAEAEALLKTFERQNADNKDKQAVEAQRRYLGGDSEHSILVKGLDFALLEQYKAKESTETIDDESLESAFVEAAKPQKRTREEIVSELKAKRLKTVKIPEPNDPTVKSIEEAKSVGKFKPIGSKVVETPTESKNRGAKKMKKMKLNTELNMDPTFISKAPEDRNTDQNKEQKASTSAIGASHISDNFDEGGEIDIFADAGEYLGLDLDDDDDDENPEIKEKNDDDDTNPTVPPSSWFVNDDQMLDDAQRKQLKEKEKETTLILKDSEDMLAKKHDTSIKDQELEIQKPARLAPLASSSIPSIRDMLSMDEALVAKDRRKAKKEKRKGGGGGGDEKKSQNAEAKLNRDYQKLKSYTEKRSSIN